MVVCNCVLGIGMKLNEFVIDFGFVIQGKIYR